MGLIFLLSPMYGNIIDYAKSGDLAQVKTCVENGADVNIETKNGDMMRKSK